MAIKAMFTNDQTVFSAHEFTHEHGEARSSGHIVSAGQNLVFSAWFGKVRPTNNPMWTITKQPGTYVLILVNSRLGVLPIGQLGDLSLQPGVYVYVGSAWGPGGLAARVQHHYRISSRPHWHIDYLRARCDLNRIWFTTASGRVEHKWAKALARLPKVTVPLQGFGASDCRCNTHLFWFPSPPSLRAFQRQVSTRVWAYP